MDSIEKKREYNRNYQRARRANNPGEARENLLRHYIKLATGSADTERTPEVMEAVRQIRNREKREYYAAHPEKKKAEIERYWRKRLGVQNSTK